MNIEHLHQSLDSELTPEIKRQELITYLKMCTDELPSEDSDRRAVAYRIAGLLSTRYAGTLSSNDKINEILTLASELEIPDDNNPSKWLELCKLVDSL